MLEVQIAITILVLNDVLVEKDCLIAFASGKESYGSPGDQNNLRIPAQHHTVRKEACERAYRIVKDIVDRRTDGRAISSEPFDEFVEHLDALGYGVFRMWWKQLVSELRHTSIQVSPVSVTVLSAALV